MSRTPLFRRTPRSSPTIPPRRPLLLAVPTVAPPSTVSPAGPDVPEVIPGQLIESEWGSAVADDLAELWEAIGTAPGTPGPAGPTGPAGAPGAAGAPGPQGDQGEAGGSLLAAFWTFNATATAPPAVGQARSPVGNTTLWVHKTDTDGFNRTAGLATVQVGNLVYVRAQNGSALNLTITGVADSGTYMTFTTTVASGTLTKGARTQLNFVLALAVGLPSGGTVNQVLGKASATDYDVSWRDDVSGAPTRRTVKADTTTAYAPVVADENTMVTLSNAAAITVTMPSNATAAFPVGAEVEFVWLGAGQPTFTAGSGATVNGTPGLKLRVQYSKGTAKKIGTNAWLMSGDLAP